MSRPEKWSVSFTFTAEPDEVVSVAEMASTAADSVLRTLVNDCDLWPDYWSVVRVDQIEDES